MAPFAFLGPAYDDALREFCTTTASRDIFLVLSFIPQLLGGASFVDSAPLRAHDPGFRRHRIAIH